MWYTYILFFAFTMSLVGGLSFVLGRIMDITASTAVDYGTFEEVPIFGDVTPEDVSDFATIEEQQPGMADLMCGIPNVDASAFASTNTNTNKRYERRQVVSPTEEGPGSAETSNPDPTQTFNPNPPSTFTFNVCHFPSTEIR
jgi:hypothetical protein